MLYLQLWALYRDIYFLKSLHDPGEALLTVRWRFTTVTTASPEYEALATNKDTSLTSE
jgi:hypothetical protein